LVAEVSPPANRRSVLDHPSKLGTHTAKPRATPTPIRWPATIDKIISQQGEVWPALTQHVSTSHVVGIVGLTPRCGATTLAIALVKALLTADPTAPNPQASDCRTRRNILLVDANFANPMIAPWFQLPTDSAWNEGSHSPLDSSSGKTLPGPAGLQILPLTCGIRHPRQPPPSATDPDEIQNSIRYYLPENAAGPMVRKLQDVLQTQRSIHQHVVADLGTLGFWANTGLLPTLATSCQQILFVVPKNFDNRIASQQYWQLQDAGCQAIAMLENTK
jgi:hypothetical protein